MGTDQAEEISLTTYGGLTTMLCGAGLIISVVFGLILENRTVEFLMGGAAALSLAGFVLGLLMYGMGMVLEK
jgi:hypothetical protein